MRLRGIRNIGLTMAAALIAINVFADDFIIHEVKKGETIYGIASKYHVSSNDILEANPQAVNGVKKGMTLRIPAQSTTTSATYKKTKEKAKNSTQAAANPALAGFQTKYTVDDAVKSGVAVPERADDDIEPVLESRSYCAGMGDTFASISRKTGVSQDALIDLNPFLDPDNLIAGTMVRLTEDAPLYGSPANVEEASQPISAADEPASAEAPVVDPVVDPDTFEMPQNPMEARIDSTYIDSEHLNILILLPFMAESESPSRQAKNYADFYRGFLIAAKESTVKPGNDIEVITLDASADPSQLQQQLDGVIDRDLAVIIAPEDSRQLQTVIDYATPKNVYVLNMFNFSDENYKTNPYVLQGNINQQLMYEKAINYLLENYDDCVPVILAPSEAKEEKAPFINALREAYSREGRIVREIPFEEGLTEETVLASLDPTQNYVFIPKSGAQSVFNRFAPALVSLQNQENGKERFRLFGYPDWVAYRGESLDLLQRLDAVIYSRFLSDEKDLENKDLQQKFQMWYGRPMIEAVPSQGLLGYDTGRFLLYTLQRGTMERQLDNPISFKGLQNSFKFTHDDENEGYVNEVLYIIQFMTGDNYRFEQL
ncbi:MAG: LysM peptidoglycan-binding domain-containing protein [Bacteroidales bacterium]|nr:LysM peptidoglycan-binding domain-containing protein [Bacteroidales bacterium]